MNPTLIGWILTGVMVLFIVAGLLWGLIRGLNKTAFRGAWIIVTAIILIFLTPVVTGSLLKINFSFLDIEISGVQLTTLGELIDNLIANSPDISAAVSANPSLIILVANLPFVVFNAIIYAVCFWLFKIILWPIWAVLSRVILKMKKPDKDGNPKRKRRGYGMLVGAFIGLVVGATTLMPVLGLVDTVVSVDRQTALVATQDSDGLLSDFLDQEYIDYIYAYENSVLKKVLKYTGIDFLNTKVFDYLSTTKVNNQKINLKSELTNFALTYVNVMNVQQMLTSGQNLTKEDIDSILTLAQNLNERLFDSGLIKSVADEILPYLFGELANNDQFFIQIPSTGDNNIDLFIHDTLLEFSKLTVNDIKNDINCLLESAKILNNCGILESLFYGGDAETILDSITNEVIEQLNDSLFNMKTANALIPLVLNTAIEMAADYLDINDFNNTGKSTANLKQTMEDIFKSVFAVATTFDSSSDFYIAESSLSFVGKIIDIIKNYDGITPTAFKQLVNAVETKLIDIIDQNLAGSLDVSQDLLDTFYACIGNLSEVTSYEQELTKFIGVVSDVVQIIKDLEEDPTDLNFVALGGILDSLKTTEIFGTNIDAFVRGFIDMAADMLDGTDPTMASLKTVLLKIKDNVNSSLVYADVFPPLQGLVDVLLQITDVDNLSQEFLSGTSTLLADFGKALDQAKTSALIGNVIDDLVVEVFNIAKSSLSFGDSNLNTQMTHIFNSIIYNIENPTGTISWENEFANLKALFNLIDISVEGTIEYQTIGQKFDQIAQNSLIITSDVIKDLVEVLFDQAIDSMGNIFTGDYVDIPYAIKNAIANIQNFETEFKFIGALVNNLSTYIGNNDYAAIGTLIDSYYESSALSKAIANVLTDIIDTAFEDINLSAFATGSSILNVYDNILSNAKTLTVSVTNRLSFETMFAELEILQQNTVIFTDFTLSNLDGDEITSTLNMFKSLSVVGLDNTKTIAEYVLDGIYNQVSGATASQDKDDLLQQITDIKTNITTSSDTEMDFATEFGTLFNVITIFIG